MKNDKKNQNPEETCFFRQEIDLQNIFYCLCVVLIHLFPQQILQHKPFFLLQRGLFCSIYGFLFLSGFKCFYRRKKWREQFSSRFKKIVLPYAAAVPFYCIAAGETPSFKLFLTRLLTGDSDVHFYFVIVILQFYLLTPLFYLLLDKCRKKNVLLLSGVLTLLTVLLLCQSRFYNRIFTRYLFCYIIGCYAGKEYHKFAESLQKNNTKTAVLYFLLLILELWTSVQFSFGAFPLILKQAVTAFYMPFSILFFYRCSLSIVSKHPVMKHKIFQIINKNTYFIYLWHILAIHLADKFSVAAGTPLFLTRGAVTISALAAVIALKEKAIALNAKLRY